MAKPAARLQSFAYALQGVAFLVRTQANARLHLLPAAAVLIAAAIGVLVFVPHLARLLQ